MTPKKADIVYLNPAWLAKTAKLAMKRGTALIFSKDRCVYGILPKSGGSVNVFYETDEAWLDAVLTMFPDGAVFPGANLFGGAETAKALRAYANIRLPEDGGKARIDPLTHALHVKGIGVTIHSATFETSEGTSCGYPSEIPSLSLGEAVPKDIGKLMVEFTRRDDNRPFAKRICALGNGEYLGATDGRGAILHKVEDIPEDFSFDPTLVNMYDIVGYRRMATETGAVINVYRLIDGSVFVEKVSADSAPLLCKMFETFAAKERHTLLSSAMLRKLEEDIVALGLGNGDSFGGVIVFTADGVTMKVRDQDVAEFDCTVSMPKGVAEIGFALPLLSRVAKLGGDLTLALGEKLVGYSETAETRMLVMPLLMSAAQGAPA